VGALSTGQFPQRRETDEQQAFRIEQLLARWKTQGIEPPPAHEPLPFEERRNRDLTVGKRAA
jgi:hypothetical protein